MSDDFLRSAIEVIQAYAARQGGFVSEATLQQRGLAPNTPGLLFIGGLGAPAFQFDGETLRPIVAEINQLANAISDPVRIGYWWLSPHKLLSAHASPSTLVADPDQHFVLRRLVNHFIEK